MAFTSHLPELTMRQCRVILGEWHLGIRPQRVVLWRCPDCFVEVSAEGRRCRPCHGRSQRGWRTSKQAEAIERYRQGETSAVVAEAIDVSRERVCQYLRPTGEMRPAGPKKMTCGPSGGCLRKGDRSKWRENYRRQCRLLDRRRIVRLYKQRLGCMDIGQKIPRLGAYGALKVLRQAGVSIRPVGKYDHSKRAAPQCCPWDLWLDGQVRALKYGVDFTCKPVCLRQNAYQNAKRRSISVRVSIQGDVVTMQGQGA